MKVDQTLARRHAGVRAISDKVAHAEVAHVAERHRRLGTCMFRAEAISPDCIPESIFQGHAGLAATDHERPLNNPRSFLRAAPTLAVLGFHSMIKPGGGRKRRLDGTHVRVETKVRTET